MYRNTNTAPTEEIVKQNYPYWKYIRTDRNGTRYFQNCRCERCAGKGVIPYYSYIDGGVCYKCGGSGFDEKGCVEKVYTETYAAKLEENTQKREAARINNIIKMRGQNLIKAGFGEENGEYVIYRAVGDTFEIKDHLKEIGCKFNYSVGWFSATKLSDIECQRLTEHDVLTDSIYIQWKDRGDIEHLFVENIRKAESSSYVGEIGDKITIKVYIDTVFTGSYTVNKYISSPNYTYIMHDDNGNYYKWRTALFFKPYEDYVLCGTVKDHTEYKGVKQTILTRCKQLKF